MEPSEREKLNILKASLEQRVEQRDHHARHVGKKLLKGGLVIGGIVAGAILAANSKNRRGIGGQSAQLLGAAVASMLPGVLLSEELKADPQAVVPDEDMDAILAYVRKRLASGLDARNRATIKGGTLVLCFRGRSSYSGKNLVASCYLHALLGSPGEPLPPTELVRRFGRAARGKAGGSPKGLLALNKLVAADYARGLSGERAASSAVAEGVDAYAIADREAEVGAKVAISRLDDQLAKLSQRAVEKRKKLEKERNRIQAYLRTLTRPGGKTTQFVSDQKKAATNVRNNVKRELIPHLAAQDSELAEHLLASLRFEASGCVYAPDPQEEWLNL